MGHGRAPGVQHGGDADAGAEMLWVGRDGVHGLGRGLEQKIIDNGLVLVGDVANPRRQREDDVEVRHRQELSLARRHPLARCRALTLGAVPVAAAVVGNGRVSAVLAARDMAAESRRAAALDRAHHLQLSEAHMAGVGAAPCGTTVAEDVRDFQGGTGHDRRRVMSAAVRAYFLRVEGDDPVGSSPRG
jgi:hypothetical protein